MRERGLTNVGNLHFSGASRWSASESFRVEELSTGEVRKFQPALTYFPVRWVREVSFPVRMVREIDR